MYYFFGDTFFETLLLKNVFQIILILYFSTEFLISTITSLYNLKSKGKKNKDGGSCFILIGGCIGSIYADALLRIYFGLSLPDYFFWIGSLAAIIGIFLRVYSVLTLRKAFTYSVQVKQNQKIVKRGPYRYIRHPAYSGSILTLLGISLCFRSIFSLIISIIIIGFIYGYRIKLEEKVLENNFGSEYEEYEKETWRIIPHIW